VTEPASKLRDPPPVRLGRLSTPSAIRCACTRVGNAVLSGKLDPRKANSALYAIAGAKSAMDLEQQAKALELEQQRVNIEAARSNTGKPTSVTPETVLDAWRVAPLPATPLAQAAIAPIPVAVPAAAVIAALEARREAREAGPGESPVSPRELREEPAPRAPKEQEVIEAVPLGDGVYGVTVVGTEAWRRVPADMVPIGPIPTGAELRTAMLS
jgi:hypothetical protein